MLVEPGPFSGFRRSSVQPVVRAQVRALLHQPDRRRNRPSDVSRAFSSLWPVLERIELPQKIVKASPS